MALYLYGNTLHGAKKERKNPSDELILMMIFNNENWEISVEYKEKQTVSRCYVWPLFLFPTLLNNFFFVFFFCFCYCCCFILSHWRLVSSGFCIQCNSLHSLFCHQHKNKTQIIRDMKKLHMKNSSNFFLFITYLYCSCVPYYFNRIRKLPKDFLFETIQIA